MSILHHWPDQTVKDCIQKKKKTPDEGTKDSFSTTKNKEKPQSLRQAFEI